MAKRITLALGMFLLVAAMIVPMMVTTVGADTNKAYAVWGFDGSRSGGGYNQIMFGGGGNESTAGARLIKISFVFRGFVDDVTYTKHPHSIGMYTPNTCGMGYSLEAGGAFYKTGIWTDTDGLSSSYCQTAYTLVPNKNYDFEWRINKNSITFLINGTQVATQSGITNDGWTIFVPQGVIMDIYYVMLYRYSVNNVPSDISTSLTWGAGMGALGGGADCDSFGTGLGLTCFGTTSGSYWVYENYPCERVYLGTDLNAVNAYNAIDALPASGSITLSNESAVTSARSAYNALSSGFQSYIKDTSFEVYSKLTAAEAVITDIKAANAVITNITNIGTVTVNSGSAISTARTNYDNLSSAQKNRVSNYSTLTAAETEYNKIRPVYDAIANLGTITVNSGTAISNAESSYSALTSAQKNKITNYSTLTAARTEYNTIRPVYDAIANLGTITVNSGSAITSAESSYSALTSAQKNKITNYSTLTAARTEYNTIRPVYDAILNVGDVNPASDSNIVSAEDSYAALNSDQKAKITNYSDLTDARTEYNTIHPVYTQIEGLGTITLASKSAISTAKSAYTALSASQQAKVDAANSRTIAQAETEYNGRIPVATMSGTPDSSKIKANAYFTLTDGEDLSKITVSFGDTSGTIQSLISSGVLRSSSAGGGKTDYILSCTMAAKRMTDPLNYSVSGYGETYHEGVASVKYYCNALISGSYSEEVKAVANAMLVYGGCAQRYFNYNTSNIASADVPSDTSKTNLLNTYSRFDYSKLQSDMSAGSIPVSYTAMNVSFLDDTTFYIVFRIKDSSTEANRTAALNWVKTNVTYDNKKFDGTVAGNSAKIVQSTGGNYYYVQITVQNIPISQVLSTKALTVNSIDYQIGVVNYLVAAQSGSNANLTKLTLALYEYAKAMNQLTA